MVPNGSITSTRNATKFIVLPESIDRILPLERAQRVESLANEVILGIFVGTNYVRLRIDCKVVFKIKSKD